MNREQSDARLCLINQVLDATTPEEIARADDALHRWMQAHPDDLGMVDGFEQLFIMKDASTKDVPRMAEAGASPGDRKPAQVA